MQGSGFPLLGVARRVREEKANTCLAMQTTKHAEQSVHLAKNAAEQCARTTIFFRISANNLYQEKHRADPPVYWI